MSQLSRSARFSHRPADQIFDARILAVAAAFLAAFSTAGTPLARAQTTTLPTTGLLVRITQVDASHYPDLTLYVSANDASGRTLNNLTMAQVKVTADGQPITGGTLSPVETKSPPPPLTLVMAMDVSDSMKGQAIADARISARDFVDSLEGPTRIGLFSFGSKVQRIQNFTDDKNLIRASIDGLSATDTTALYEAIYQATESVKSESGRKAVVVLTDGWNYLGGPRTLDQARQMAIDANAPLYLLGFGSAHETVLRPLADATRGIYIYRPQSSQLRDLFGQLGGELSSQYILACRALINPDGKEHTITVEITKDGASGRDSRTFIAVPGAGNGQALPLPGPTPLPTPPPIPNPGLGPLAWLGLLLLMLALLAPLALLLVRRRRREVWHVQEETMMVGMGSSVEEPLPDLPVVAAGAVDSTMVLHPPPQAMAWLVAMNQGPHHGHEFQLNREDTLIGRAGDNDLVFDDEDVSRYHAKVRHEGSDFVIYDMGATNPSRVNGEEVTRHVLKEGDIVEVGATKLRFMSVETGG